MWKKLLILSLLIPLAPFLARTQPSWKQPEQRLNVIKFNPTPMLLWDSKNITLSYERLIKPDQSVSVKLGYLVFPNFFSDTILDLLAFNSVDRYGINIGAEYRWYPSSRNARKAPDGVYIGPYIGYYGYHATHDFEILYSSVEKKLEFTTDFSVFNAGFQLGYQFIFWKRLSIDLILFGPSLSYYWGSVEFKGQLDQEEIDNIDNELINNFLENHPSVKSFLGGEELKFTGSKAKWSFGFRYAIQIGCAF